MTIEKQEDVNNLLDPWKTDADIYKLPYISPLLMGDLTFVPENPLQAPPDIEKNLVTYGNTKQVLSFFPPTSATEEALGLWNNACENNLNSGSFIHELRKIFARFSTLIKLKSFKERRIHRFINEYSKYLLPSFVNCYFEMPFHLGNKTRKADFILEREKGLPPIIVELESPVHKVFRKNGEFTGEVNHAKYQIAEWISIIESDPLINASGKFSFLIGPKERLVIIGRGLEHKDKLILSKHTDTTIWTYEFFYKKL